MGPLAPTDMRCTHTPPPPPQLLPHLALQVISRDETRFNLTFLGCCLFWVGGNCVFVVWGIFNLKQFYPICDLL